MQRRAALHRIGILSGAAVLATSGVFSACKWIDKKRTALTENDIPLLDEIGDTILPTTATSPGAKAANIGAYMLVMVNDCYTEKQRMAFIEGLNSFDALCKQQYKSDFIALNAKDRKQLLVQLDGEAKASANDKSKAYPEHYFSMLKHLTISGYFSSKIGATQALRYEPVPGKYQGCIPYTKGDKPWATT